MKPVLFLIAVLASTVAAEELPPQFAAWGTRGPAYPAAPAGWTELPAEPRVRAAPVPTAHDSARGFIVFQRPAFEEICHDTVPAPFEVGAKLHAFGSPGEYLPLSIGLFGLEDLAKVTASASECRAKTGGAIGVKEFDVRIVRPVRCAAGAKGSKQFRMVPFYMEKADNFAITKGQSAQIWITVHIPETEAAGEYEGVITIKAGGKTAAAVPVQLRVLPLKLPPVPIETLMSFAKKAGDPRLREKELIDMREHGIVANEDAIGAEIVSRDKIFGDDDVAATKEACRAMLELRKKVYGANPRLPITATIGHQILYEWINSRGWFEFWPHAPKTEADFFKAIDTVGDVCKAEGVPFRVFIMDEPGGHPDMFKETIYYNRLLKEQRPDQQTYVTVGGGMAIGVDEIGQLGPYIDMLNTNRFSPSICKTLLDRKKPYGIYNGGGATERIRGYTRDRYFFGFYCWKTGASQVLQWVYAFGEPWKTPVRDNEGYVYPAADGPLPSVAWESIRAGIVDYRYTDLLWRLITAAKTSNDAKALAAAKAGEAIARNIAAQIDFNYQPRDGEGSPPPSARTLELWRWQTASACLDLLKCVPIEKARATRLVRPGPLDFSPTKNEALLKTGPELLPDSTFEAGPGPWVSMGKFAGKSNGVDASQHHGGAKSFQLVNRPEASGVDVTVCVWGWGGPAPAMKLQAGKTYAFSAWMLSRSGMPQLRLEMPNGSVRAEKAGEDMPETGGWQRHWLRITLAANATPKYFAVWLQGPGQIWIDDFSFTEVHEPPIVLAVPPLCAASDRTLPVRIAQPGGSALKVHVSLTGTPQTHDITIPPGGSETVDFDLHALTLGTHAIRAEADGMSAAEVPASKIEVIRGPFDDEHH